MSLGKPAFSNVFAPTSLQLLRRVEPIDNVTPDWAWGGSTGRGVKVAVIDSGIDASHPAVGGPIQGYVAISDGPDGCTYDTSPHEDAYGHGTACAGIIRGLAAECELYSVRVLGATLTGRGSAFAAGLLWAINNGMQVCNVSIGTTKRDFFAPLHELADLAYFRNVMLVVAANNVPEPSYPSVYASVISVAAHEFRDPRVFYYNPTPPVEFGAAGIDVRVAWQGGGWITATGNSFAAPHIAGIVAQILAKHPGLTSFQVKMILRALAANIRREGPIDNEESPHPAY
jgi:subtilisin